MSNPLTPQPVTWQDYANWWGNDPAHREKYALIKPTLDALGITPQDIIDPPNTQTHIALPETRIPPGNKGSNELGPGFPPQGEPYKDAILNASQKTGVPPGLLAGLIHDESRWDAGAGTTNANGLGDTGLVQMNDGTFAELQQKHPELQGKNKNDPETNILAGAFYLADMKEEMKQRYGIDSWEIALRAYNSGPNGVDPNNLSSLPAGTGTANYVDKVMSYWKIVDEGGTLPP